MRSKKRKYFNFKYIKEYIYFRYNNNLLLKFFKIAFKNYNVFNVF